MLQLSINWAESARPRSADVSRASRSSSTRFDNPRRVRNDLGQIQDPVPTESTPLFSSSDVDDVQGADQSFPIQDQISSFITAPSSSDEIDSPVTASPFNPEVADPVPEPFIGVEPAEESSDSVADEPIFGVAPQSFAGIEGIPVAAPEQVESTQQELQDPSVDFRIVSQQPFPTILVNPPPPPQQVQDPAPVDVVLTPEIVAEPLPLEPVVIQSQSSTEAPLNEPSPPVDAPIPVKLELSPPSGYQSLTHQTEKPSLYQVLPPSFFGILYPIPAPHSSYSVGPQVPYDQPKNYPAPTYGPPRLTHPTTQQHHHQGNNENYPRRQFGFPPTPRALGFPPISNTRDNLHREVNWGRLGRPYRSA